MANRKQLVLAAAIALGTGAYAQSSISRLCPNPSSGICYELNIPEVTANSGSGDIFFSITAPTTYEWVALGQGSGMPDSNIFVVYTSANGQNVTVSSRPSAMTGYYQPRQQANNAELTVLSGSGINNGMMTAHVRCSNCNSWNGGTMDFSSTSGSWIHAELSGTPLQSDDLNAEIMFHSNQGVFDWPFDAAKGGSDANPFTTAGATATVTDSSDDSASSSPSGPPANLMMVLIAHGVMAALAFVIVFPTGGILIRVANFSGLVWIHAVIQMLGYALWIPAFGMGLWMAIGGGYTTAYHSIIGYVLFALVVFQPVGGLLHHFAFKKTGGRTAWSFGHIFIGRIAVILGIINGGFGLQLAGNAPMGAVIAYGVVGGIFGLAYIASIVFGEHKRRSRSPKGSFDGSSSEHKSRSEA